MLNRFQALLLSCIGFLGSFSGEPAESLGYPSSLGRKTHPSERLSQDGKRGPGARLGGRVGGRDKLTGRSFVGASTQKIFGSSALACMSTLRVQPSIDDGCMKTYLGGGA